MPDDDIPERWRVLVKDWPKLPIPEGLNPHSLVQDAGVPLGSYLVVGQMLYGETQAIIEAVKARIVELRGPQEPEDERGEPGEQPGDEWPDDEWPGRVA